MEELLKISYKSDESSFLEFLHYLPKESVKDFVIDMLVLANIKGQATREIYEYIVDFLDILEFEEKYLEKAVKLSKIILKIGRGKDKADFQKLNWEDKVASRNWSKEYAIEEKNKNSDTEIKKRTHLFVYELAEILHITTKEIVLYLRDKDI